MFPSSLQKNIRELDRQISLLETECDNMEAENTPGKITAPEFDHDTRPSQGMHFPKMLTLPPVTPRTHPCAHSRPLRKDSKSPGDSPNHLRRSEKRESSATREGINEMMNASFEGRKHEKGSKESVKVMESSDDSYPIRVEIHTAKQKNSSADTSREPQIWCELVKEKVSGDNSPNRKGNKKTADEREFVEPKFSSDEERNRRIRFATGESHFLSEDSREFEPPMTSRSRISTKRRPRSVRTRKKSDEVPVDVNFTKINDEKEIQCILWSEETEKSEFLQNLNESIRILQALMEELKTKTSQENRNDVMSAMQNILMKLKSLNALQNPLKTHSSLKGIDERSLEGEENFRYQKKALLAVKKFCQELSEEKSALTEELNTKNSKITNLKIKEKEYLSLISNLKFNLESLREETEEGKLAKRDLLLMKAKLREEAKVGRCGHTVRVQTTALLTLNCLFAEQVIEVLKRSHGKMQALVEHYVLENDKLRAEAKMAKLESQKFHVLLSAKEVEIIKYKQEIELFQRQINQQLNFLRSKATEKEVEHAIEVISAQASIFHTEVDSLPSETTFEKREQSLAFDLTETTSSARTPPRAAPGGEAPPPEGPMSAPKREQGGEGVRELKDVETHPKDNGFTSCKSEDSLAEGRGCERKYSQLCGVVSGSKNLRSSVDEMLEEMRRGSSDKFWPSPCNSSNSSRCSAVSSYIENVSESSQRD